METNYFIPSIWEVIPYTYEELQEDFESVITKFLVGASSSEKPVFVHMLGIPAAGKTTFYRENKERLFNNYLFIGFDYVMEAHPEYQQDVETLGSVEAFKKWEIPARIAGYELLRRAVEQKKNIFFDHGGTPKCHQELITNVKALGYRTEMYYISCPVEVAIERAKAREKLTKRHTPEQMIRDRVALVEENKKIYENLVDVFVEL